MSADNFGEINLTSDGLMQEIMERRRTEAELEQHNQLLSVLLEVSNLVSSSLEIKPLLEAILDRLKKIIDYKGAKIFVIEDEILKVIAHRSALSGEEELRYFFSHKQLPLSREIILDKRPVVISDVWDNTATAKSFRKTMKECLEGNFDCIHSWIGIPMIIRDRVIGVLTIDHDQSGYYRPKHAEIGMAFANQAAIELENARLYNETMKRADELKTMFSVQQAITSRLDLDAVMQLISDEAKRLILSKRAAVFMVEADELVLTVFSGEGNRELVGYRMSINSSFAGQTIVYGKPLLVNNAQNNPIAFPGLVEKAGIKSFLCVPMTAGTRRIGAIAVADKLNGEFNQEDERILSMLASTAVIGIENARMYQEEHRRHLEDERRRRVAEGLRDILTILNSNRPTAEILEYIIKQAARLMGTDTGALYRLRQDEGFLTIEAACGLTPEYIERMSIPVGMGAIGRAVAERKSVVVTDIKAVIPKEFLDDPGREVHLAWIIQNFQGYLAVPLICKDEVYGGILLYCRQQRDFSKEEIELAMTFTDQAALAIDNARLRAQAEQLAVAAERSRLARDLHDAVTQTLFSVSLIAEVLPRIWERSPEEGRKRLEELRQLARGALAEMRTLLLELRPATLVEAGVEELLRHLCEATTGRARVPVSLGIEGRGDIPTDVKIALYRIAQEALNNIAKHSEANRASVTLRIKPGESGEACMLELIISDDGRGFNPDEIAGEHLGIGIMKERSEAIGANLAVESKLKHGTNITIYWDGSKGGKD